MKSLFFLLFGVPILLLSQNTDINKSLNFEGRERSYVLHLPQNYNPKNNYPLVIGLHGGGGKAKSFNKSTNYRFNELADEEGFITVYPQGIGKSWNDNKNRAAKGAAREKNIDDVGFINEMLHQLIQQYGIDTTAIFACGISNGGLMAATLAAKLPHKIKGIGMVASNFSEVFIKELAKNPAKPFPMLLIQGTVDPIFPYQEGEVKVFKQTRGKVIGVEKTIAFMCNLNGNNTVGEIAELPNIVDDGCTSVRINYPNAINSDLKIELIKINGGGHTWPGGNQYLPKRMIGRVTTDFNACDELWRFFKSLKSN